MIDAERAVLGCLLEDATLLAVAEGNSVSKHTFSVPENGIIYEAIRELITEDKPVDLVMLHSHLTNTNMIQHAGGAGYVASILDDPPYIPNFEHYVEIVRDSEIRKSIIEGLGAINAGHDLSGKELLALAESIITQIGDSTFSSVFTKAQEVVDNIVVKLEEGEISSFGVPTGFTALDRMILGMHKGNLITVAARPGMGKTAFAKDVAKAAALEGYHVATFSLEMDKEELGFRILSDFTELPTEFLKAGKFGDIGWKNIMESRRKIEKLPLYFEDKADITIPELMSKVRRLKKKVGLDMVIVDYLQLMESGFRKENRMQEVSAITRSLKKLAKSMNIPIIALSQLNRKVEERIDQRPLLSDLRESGSIEQDSDIVIFIHQKIPQEDAGAPRVAEIIVAKNRNGRVGSVYLTFQPTLTRFINRKKKNEADHVTT